VAVRGLAWATVGLFFVEPDVVVLVDLPLCGVELLVPMPRDTRVTTSTTTRATAPTRKDNRRARTAMIIATAAFGRQCTGADSGSFTGRCTLRQMPDTDPDGFSRRVDDIAGTTRRILATVSSPGERYRSISSPTTCAQHGDSIPFADG